MRLKEGFFCGFSPLAQIQSNRKCLENIETHIYIIRLGLSACKIENLHEYKLTKI